MNVSIHETNIVFAVWNCKTYSKFHADSTFQNMFTDCYNSRGTKVAYRAKTHIFAPESYTAGILYTDSLNSA